MPDTPQTENAKTETDGSKMSQAELHLLIRKASRKDNYLVSFILSILELLSFL